MAAILSLSGPPPGLGSSPLGRPVPPTRVFDDIEVKELVTVLVTTDAPPDPEGSVTNSMPEERGPVLGPMEKRDVENKVAVGDDAVETDGVPVTVLVRVVTDSMNPG